MLEHNLILYWKPAIEIVILWFLIYQIMLFFEGTRALQALRGIIILLLAFLIFDSLPLRRSGRQPAKKHRG